MRFFLFFVTLFALLSACSRYLGRRAVSSFGLGPRARRAIDVVLFGALAVIAAARLLEQRLPAEVLQPIALLGFAVALTTGISAVLLGAADLLLYGVRLVRRRAATAREEPAAVRAEPATEPAIAAAASAKEEAASPARRDFLAQAAAGTALAVGGGSAFHGTLLGRHDFRLEEVPVKIPGLGRQLDGFTLVQISDVHLGLFVRDREMRAAEDLVRRAKPDLIVLTGDLVDHDAREVDALGGFVTRLAALAKGGVVAVPGNHDYYAGVAAVMGAVSRAGGRVLRNDGLVIGGAHGFALLGVDDVWGPRVEPDAPGPDLGGALAKVPEAADRPRILLCHNPVTFPVHAGKVALQLSGHTHGGQVNVGVRLADVVLGHPYIAGRYEREGSTIYVNRGFGTAGPPARVGSPPEVSRIVLVAG